jgi:hypothetical protein
MSLSRKVPLRSNQQVRICSKSTTFFCFSDINKDECKRERQEENTVDVKLSVELRELLGGRRHVKEEELTRAVLLDWAKRQGAVKEVHLISITVQTMGGTELEVKLDDTANSASCLKQGIQDGHGICILSTAVPCM